MAVDMELELHTTVNSSDECESDDEQVREIDVYLAPEMSEHLYLLQYPGQHEPVEAPMSGRIKPRHGILQTEHPGYDRTLRTFDSQTIPVTTHMCIGKVRRHENAETINLVPLSHIVQMRPNFASEDFFDEPAEVEDADKKKPVTFQRKESDRAAAARKSSYAFKKASEEVEEWIDLRIDDGESNFLSGAESPRPDILQKLCCADRTRCIVAIADNASTNCEASYVQSLNYLAVPSDSRTAAVSASVLDTSKDTEKQRMKRTVSKLASFLQGGSPIPYSILKSQLPSVSDDDLLSALNVCGVLCRGNWCLHSKFLGVPENCKMARTLLLSLLQETGKLDRGRLTRILCESDTFKSRASVSPKKLLALLQLVARRSCEGWELKIDEDVGFIATHSSIVELHSEYWERQRNRFRQELHLYHSLPASLLPKL